MIYPWSPFTFGVNRATTSPGGSAWKTLLMFRWFFRVPGLPPAPDNRYLDKFKWCDPLTFKDGEMGEVCQISGAWFPGHMMRTITDPESPMHGKRVGAPFYSPAKPYRDVQPRTWGEPSE